MRALTHVADVHWEHLHNKVLIHAPLVPLVFTKMSLKAKSANLALLADGLVL